MQQQPWNSWDVHTLCDLAELAASSWDKAESEPIAKFESGLRAKACFLQQQVQRISIQEQV
jgi:hypothetical protein